MSSRTAYADFLSAVGASFCDAFADHPDFEDASPHDFQQVLLTTVANPLTPSALRAARTPDGLARISAECERYFEVSAVSEGTIDRAIERSLGRWPE